MNQKQAKRLAFHQGYSPCPSSAMGFNSKIEQVLPETPNSLPNQEAPDESKRFNGLSLDEVSAFREVKSSDPLHRADKLAKTYYRGKKLNRNLADNGHQKFLQHYD